MDENRTAHKMQSTDRQPLSFDTAGSDAQFC